MRFTCPSGLVAAIWLSATTSTAAFAVVSRHALQRTATTTSSSFHHSSISPSFRLWAAAAPSPNGMKDLHEFDYLLQEKSSATDASSQITTGGQEQKLQRHRRIVALPSSSSSQRATVLVASTSTFSGPSTEQLTEQQDALTQQQQQGDEMSSTSSSDDPYADSLDAQLDKIQQFQEQQQQPAERANRFKDMDFQDIVVTLFIPSILAYVAGRWIYNRTAARVTDRKDETLTSFSSEMIYHDGDFTEMELCVKEYKRQLVWMPNRKEAMLKRYLADYAKKKTVSPQAISSISYVFTLFKLSETKAAALLVQLCKELGTDKISSAGKLLFLGSRILKSPEGVAALEPIKDMIKSTYRDASVAETLIETSQQAMAEASYRHTVQEAGPNQKTLTIGWEVLGLDQETAQRIFQEEAAEGFISEREAMYGGQTQKYDKKGRRIDKEGKLENPEEEDDDEDDDDDEPVSNVYECSECGFTLFVAEGRESKFYGDDFKCPECGAPKDKFTARDDIDDE